MSDLTGRSNELETPVQQPSTMSDVPPLGEAVSAPRQSFTASGGWRMDYYSDLTAAGRPLVLIHSINAAASSFELAPLFEQYRAMRPVYSLDLPGFGHSARPAGDYSPERYAGTIADFIEQVVGRPADVLALSLSAEFAVRAALAHPERFDSLVLVSPTGFDRRPLPGNRVLRLWRRFLEWPLVGQGLFALVASRPSIRHFLGRSFPDGIPPALFDYACATAHQPGARHAPLAFVSGLLFTPDACDQLYDRLTGRPVLVVADQDPYIGFDRLPGFVAAHPNWQAITLAPHRGLPQWGRLPDLAAALDAFWSGVPTNGGR